MEATRVQAILRLSPELMARVKRNAKKQHCSFNSYVERLLDRETELKYPQLPPDFQVSKDILALRCGTTEMPTEEALSSDPKLTYLWEKYGKY